MAKPTRAGRAPPGPAHEPVGREGRPAPHPRPEVRLPYGLSRTFSHFVAGMMKRRGTGDIHRPEHQLVQALMHRSLGPPVTSCGVATTGRPASGSSATATHCTSRTASRRGHERVPHVRRDGRRRPVRIEHKLPLEPESRATATSPRAIRACALRSTRRSGSSKRSEAAVEIFGQDIVDHYLNAAATSSRSTTRSSNGTRALPRAQLTIARRS